MNFEGVKVLVVERFDRRWAEDGLVFGILGCIRA